MKVFYTDQFVLPLPDGHTFPMPKYRLLRERVVASGLLRPGELVTPPIASDEEIERAHERDYVERASRGELSRAEINRIGFPWSPQLIERSRRSSAATVLACRAAIEDGYAVNLAGGTHHAFRDHGEGYCIFNDSVIAARTAQVEGLVRRVVIIDTDVHQGNGTAAICADDPTIYTFSIHGAKNYPIKKERSDRDVELPDGTGDQEYLDALEVALPEVIEAARAELAIWVAGADPFEGDQLGRLKLTKPGLAERDRMVFDVCARAGLPMAITMAGGYAERIDDIVDIHWHTVREAIERSRGGCTGGCSN